MPIQNDSNLPPLIHLLDALSAQRRTGKGSDAILEAEQRGQMQLCDLSSQGVCQLPTAGLDALAEGMGITVHRKTPGDDLFSDVTLPPGWSITPTDNHMWSNLNDGVGDTRARIFYKAAFYDRRAFIRVFEDMPDDDNGVSDDKV